MAMLPKTQRLSRAEFAPLLKRGQRFFTPTFSLVWARLDACHAGKVGVVVSKKVASQSVARHRVRRQVYTLMREHMHDLCGLHVAIILNKQAEPHDCTALARDIARAVRHIAHAG